MSSPLHEIAEVIQRKCGAESQHLCVWRRLTDKFNLASADMISIAMVQLACPDLSREVILRSMQYFCGGGLRVFEFVVAVDVETDILELSSDDIIRFIDQKSTIGLTNPDTGESFDQDLPVISFFRPTNYFREKLEQAAGSQKA